MKPISTSAAVILIGTALGLVGGCRKEPREAPKPVVVVQPAPGAQGLRASGRPAITPTGNAQISDAQVRSFVMSHKVPRAQATNVAILSTSFISSAQVSALLHTARIDVPDDEPTCLVVMSGKFVFSGPPGGRTVEFPIAIEVFDAKTGHLLQYGGLARPPETSAR
jgi:hypothetical protein